MLTFVKKSEASNRNPTRSDRMSSVRNSNSNSSSDPNEECSHDLWLQSHKPTSTKDLAMHVTRVIAYDLLVFRWNLRCLQVEPQTILWKTFFFFIICSHFSVKSSISFHVFFAFLMVTIYLLNGHNYGCYLPSQWSQLSLI